MATAKSQRITSFLLALFLLASSIGAVLLVIKQSNDQAALSDSLANSQLSSNQTTPEETCTVPDGLKNQQSTPPTDIPKVDTAPADLQVTDLREGTGEAVQLNDCITVNYRLFLSDGTPVAGNDTFTSGSPIAFELVQGGLIEGWIKGIPGMKVGGMRRLVIPPSLAYGETERSGIPANSTLIFDIELLDTNR